MSTETTIDAADAVVSLLNAAGLSEGITFARTFVPEFDPDDLTSPKGSVFPASIDLGRATRNSDSEDHGIEVGVGRRLAGADAETTDIETQLATVEEVLGVLRSKPNRTISTPDDSTELLFFSVEARLFIPELLRKRIALSVVRVVYRGFA